MLVPTGDRSAIAWVLGPELALEPPYISASLQGIAVTCGATSTTHNSIRVYYILQVVSYDQSPVRNIIRAQINRMHIGRNVGDNGGANTWSDNHDNYDIQCLGGIGGVPTVKNEVRGLV